MEEFQLIMHVSHSPMQFHSAEAFANYVEHQRKVKPRGANQVNKWSQFDHYPLLKIVDDKTGESFEYANKESLPKKTVINSGGRNLLIIGNG